MNKSLLIAALALAAGLFGARTASAQDTAGGTETVSSGFLNSSVFSVLATQSSSNADLWTVTVDWNKDTGFLGGTTVDEVQVGFLNSAGTVQGITNVGSGGTGTNYTASSKSNIAEWTDSKSNKGEIEQGSSFTGSVTLSSLSNPVYSVEFALNGGSFTPFVDPPGPATPEGQSLALLLPGLIPLAVMMRRRRKS
jgi:hypothetical protein